MKILFVTDLYPIINDKTMKLAGEDCPWRGSITKTNWLPMS